ncbi:MAG: hypothetical protein GX803_03955 [Lentisphaerae bacterium]|nr:hypothetical protein [Lentisphaerota bacterium]
MELGEQPSSPADISANNSKKYRENSEIGRKNGEIGRKNGGMVTLHSFDFIISLAP